VKASANVTIAMQCFEIFGRGEIAPNDPRGCAPGIDPCSLLSQPIGHAKFVRIRLLLVKQDCAFTAYIMVDV